MQSAGKITKKRKYIFLKDVFFISITAFGGPGMHLALFLKKFAQERKIVTEKELLEINSLCQILPGPSSTQTITSLGFLKGGPKLAFLTLLVWILPATLLITMMALSYKLFSSKILLFIIPMAIGFVLAAGFKMIPVVRKHWLSWTIMIIAAILGTIVFSPWLFPLLLVSAGFITVQFGQHSFVPNKKPFGKIRWANLVLYFAILVVSAIIGNLTRDIPYVSKPMLLFENTYRIGGLVFGGGNVLLPMLIEQFVYHKELISLADFNMGLGLLQGIPGPRFTISTFVNAMAMKEHGTFGQLLGALIGTVGIFLPGTLLIFFVYPIWGRLKTYPVIQRSLDGIISASVGLIFSAALILAIPYFKTLSLNNISILSALVLIVTFLLLTFTKIKSPFIILGTILLGLFYNFA